MTTNPHHDPSGRRVLRCPQCGWFQLATHADLMRYTRDGWPKCCEQTMACLTEAPRPAEAPAERPRR